MSTGTTPPGAKDEAAAARWVQHAFEEVAPKYDLLNHLLSFNIDVKLAAPCCQPLAARS